MIDISILSSFSIKWYYKLLITFTVNISPEFYFLNSALFQVILWQCCIVDGNLVSLFSSQNLKAQFDSQGVLLNECLDHFDKSVGLVSMTDEAHQRHFLTQFKTEWGELEGLLQEKEKELRQIQIQVLLLILLAVVVVVLLLFLLILLVALLLPLPVGLRPKHTTVTYRHKIN